MAVLRWVRYELTASSIPTPSRSSTQRRKGAKRQRGLGVHLGRCLCFFAPLRLCVFASRFFRTKTSRAPPYTGLRHPRKDLTFGGPLYSLIPMAEDCMIRIID